MAEFKGKQGDSWGRWHLDLSEGCPSLNISFTSWYKYWIPLRDCASEDSRQSWLCHMAEKREELISDRDLADLALAFTTLYHFPILPIRAIALRHRRNIVPLEATY